MLRSSFHLSIIRTSDVMMYQIFDILR